MSRKEYMDQLAYLLQDLPEEECNEALVYYEDYFDDAGPDKEDEVILELGSPQKVAAIIRADLNGNMEDGGEFTEKGYSDPRFDGPKKEVVPKEQRSPMDEEPKYWTNNTLKGILFIVLLVTVAKWIPRLIGLGGHAVSFLFGVLGVVLAITLLAGLTAGVLLLTGGGLMIGGVVRLLAVPVEGMMMLGGGIMVLGVGFLMVAFAICFYGKFLPFLMHSIGVGMNKLRARDQRRVR